MRAPAPGRHELALAAAGRDLRRRPAGEQEEAEERGDGRVRREGEDAVSRVLDEVVVPEAGLAGHAREIGRGGRELDPGLHTTISRWTPATTPHRRSSPSSPAGRRPASSPAGPTSGGEPYAIALPPPNVTGELHMGHALNGSIQDTLIRLRRMQGRDTLWICGTDHASIAVHAVIEKQLRAEGTTRFDLGRERFLERVWEWRAATGRDDHPAVQAAGLHARLRPRALHDGRRPTCASVLEMFVRLYRKGYIYRDNRLINWCPTCASTISDLEVRYEHAVDTLFDVRYRITGTDELPDGGDGAAGDDPGRHRGRGAPRRRALPPPGRPHRDRAARRPRGADHRRRVREDGLRHGRPQDHPGPRPERLRDRPPPRPAGALGDRLRRPHDRRSRASSPACPRRGPRQGARRPVRAGPARARSSPTSTRSATATAPAIASSR